MIFNKMKYVEKAASKMNSIHFYFLIIMVFCWGCQEDKIEPDLFGSLSGQVLFEGSTGPAANATVSTSPATSTILSLSDGTFEFAQIKVGTYSVRAELEGYLTTIESVTVFENQTTSVVLQLKTNDDSNAPPTAAQSPVPTDGSLNQDISIELSWEAVDLDDDDLTFDVYLFESGQSSNDLVAAGLTENNYMIENLRYGTVYNWQVVVNDGMADPVFGEVWSFTTAPFPEHSFVYSKQVNGVYEIFSGDVVNEFYQLTSGGSNYRPRVSPMGNRIAYINANNPDNRLFIMDRNGTNQQPLSTPFPIAGSNELELDYSWSPDGTKLLYMRGKRLYKINIDGTGVELFAELAAEDFIEVDWSGFGNRIAARTEGDFPYTSRILLYQEDGTFLEEIVSDVPGSIGGPVFSIDGNSILYTRDTSGFESPDGRQLESHIFLKNLSSGATKDLSHGKPLGFNDLDPRFSPNGALIIFTQANNFPNSQRDIFIMNIDGDGRTLLFEDSEMPDWWE
ncbi:MAG: carboxypeptidase regulatory-like domain-containing protein [Bacteroidota bacterium]